MTDFHALSGRWLLLSRPSGHAPKRPLSLHPNRVANALEPGPLVISVLEQPRQVTHVTEL